MTPAIKEPWMIFAGLVIDPSVSGRHITSDSNHDHK